jgi:ubiquinone/menaquinone biosynthesis C-methylase UbiE
MGCGTGSLGIELNSYGFSNLEGLYVDSSLADAVNPQNIYKDLYQAVLGTPINLPDNSFKVVVASSVFAKQQVPLSSFDEILRILESGGFVSLVLQVADSSYYEDLFKEYDSRNVLSAVYRERLSILADSQHDLVILKKI